MRLKHPNLVSYPGTIANLYQNGEVMDYVRNDRHTATCVVHLPSVFSFLHCE